MVRPATIELSTARLSDDDMTAVTGLVLLALGMAPERLSRPARKFLTDLCGSLLSTSQQRTEALTALAADLTHGTGGEPC